MIPDYADALTGYRCWNVFANGLMVGQSYAEPWPMYQPFVGRCGFTKSQAHVVNGHWVPAPVWHCGCGVHALKELAVAEQRLIEEMAILHGGWNAAAFADYQPPTGRVWGSVKIWGRIVEHDIGYRAEYAYPGDLYCQDAALATVVGALYGVPCTVKTLDTPRPQPQSSLAGQWYYTVPRVTSYLAPTPIATWATTTAGFVVTPAPAPASDWQTMMKNAFHVKKKDRTDA